MAIELQNLKQTYVIAEMSANHAGSLERAKEIVYAAKESGADCIKLQTYTPDTLTLNCDNPYFFISEGTWTGENLYSLYGKAYTPWEWQPLLKEVADKIGIDFFSTPFDKTSVDFLEEMGVDFYKVASFELIDIPLIAYIASKGKPMILSTGMATLGEIQETVDTIKNTNDELPFALLKCTSEYPAVFEDMNLRTIRNMKEIFEVPVGLSDHSMGTAAAITAVAMGANIIEKHFCIDRSIDNPDASFSMEPSEFKFMVQEIRNAEKALGKVFYERTENENKNICFRRSIFAVKEVQRGEKLTEDNIRVIRPGYGLEPKYYNDVIGMRVNRNLKYGEPLCWDVLVSKE